MPFNESYPTNLTGTGNIWGNGIYIPHDKPVDISRGGCFGTGPGWSKLNFEILIFVISWATDPT
jgi:hypothetical protein